MKNQKGSGQEFGGNWTQQKLAILREYLSPYARILHKQRLSFAYIDAFAGTGYRTTSNSDPSDNLDLLDQSPNQESKHFLEGSAALALSIEPHFPTLIFIEKSAAKLAQLRQLVDKHHKSRNVIFK